MHIPNCYFVPHKYILPLFANHNENGAKVLVEELNAEKSVENISYFFHLTVKTHNQQVPCKPVWITRNQYLLYDFVPHLLSP